MKFSTNILFAFLVLLAIPAHAGLSATDKDAENFAPTKDSSVKIPSYDQSALTVKPEVADDVTEAAECELCRARMKPSKTALAKLPIRSDKSP